MLRYPVLLLLVPAVCGLKRYEGHRVVSVFAKSKEELKILRSMESDHGFEDLCFEQLDFWTEPSAVFPTDIRVSPNDFVRFRQLMAKSGIAYSISKENVQRDIDGVVESQLKARLRARTRNLWDQCDIYNQYCNWVEILDLLVYWLDQYSDNMEIQNIGQTYGGNNIYQVRIASNLSQYKPAIYVECGTHAREWISVSSGLTLIHKLLTGYPGTDKMLAEYDWYIIPVLNPDGYNYTMKTENRFWRKNRAPCNGVGSGVGIDLNRNWDVGFGGEGASTSCSSGIYCGEYAFEAAETAALRDAVEALRDFTHILAFFSVHCYSQLLLVPYGYTSTKPSNYDHLIDVASHMKEASYNVDNKVFQVGTPPDILYAATGSAYDYFFLQGVSYSYTYELRPFNSKQGSSGFALPVEQIVDATEEFFQSLVAFVNYPFVN